MNLLQQQEAFENFTALQKEILLKKWNDYAQENDRLSNFKLAWAICWITAQQQCLSLIATKVARLWQLLQGREPNNEKLEDSVIDLANYSFILNCLITEHEASNN